MIYEKIIKWMLDQKLIEIRYDSFLREQMLGITELGIVVNAILLQFQKTSEVANATNEYAAEKLEEHEKYDT